MNPLVQQKFDAYPADVRPIMLELRSIILDAAEQYKIAPLDETLKWNEPSYLTATGSTLRIDWKPKNPDKCFMYFHCQTTLVETFRELYSSVLEFDGKRAIVLNVSGKLPKKELQHCASLALRYHSLKHLHLLGC